MPLIVVNALPKSVNDWRRGAGQWYLRDAESKRWRDLVGRHALFSERIAGPCRVELTFWWPTRVRRDPDNYAKAVLDGVVRSGLIEDDGPPCMTELVLRSRWDAENPRTTILYESVPEPAWPLVVRLHGQLARKRKAPPA